MIIKSITETSYSGMYKLSPQEGPAFFIRSDYLPSLKIEDMVSGSTFNEEETEELLDAGLICLVELKAVTYLARAEQSRFGLTQKLINKKYEKKYIEAALNYLQSRSYLSDQRYASAWLHDRKINHFEGRSRLAAELTGRGISREISGKALDEFFQENDESEICKKAYQRFVKQGKEGEKLIAALMKAGFTYKLIKEIME